MRTTADLRSGRRAGRSNRREQSGSGCSLSREGHDLVGREAAGRAPSELFDDRPAATARMLGTSETDGVAVAGELDLGPREQTRLLAQLDRDRHLSLGRDLHGKNLTGRTLTAPPSMRRFESCARRKLRGPTAQGF